MLVTLMLLAILTVGAVSAADLTVNETQDPVGLSVDDESIIAEDNLLGDDDINEKEDINLSSNVIPENYVKDLDYDNDGVDFRIAPEFSGFVTVTANDTTIYSEYCYNTAYGIYFSSLDYGEYNWKININDDSGRYNPFTMNGTINIVPVSIKIPEHVTFGNLDYISVIYSRYARGTITVLIDDEKYFEGELYDGEDESVKHISLTGLSFDNHTCKVIYSGYKEFKPLTVSQTFDVDYSLMYYITEDEIQYGNNATLEIYLPKDAKGNVTVNVNGKQFTAKADKKYLNGNTICLDLDISNFNLGENNFTITYNGDEKYYSKTVNATVNTIAKIQYEQKMAYSDACISLRLPDDAKGRLVVKIDDEDFANVFGKNGVFNISLSNLALGDYSLEASYDGEDYEVESVSDYIKIIPKFTYPKIVGFYEGALITVEVPEGIEGTFKIYEFDPYDWEMERVTEINSTEVIGGKASLILNKFHRVSYEYDDGNFNIFNLEFKNDKYEYQQKYYPSMRYYPRDSDFNIKVPSTVKASDSLRCYVEDSFGRTYEVYIDGIYLKNVFNRIYEEDDFEDDYITIELNNLDYGKHKIEFRYIDADGYYIPINKTYYFNISYITIDIPQEIISDELIKVEFDESVTGTLTLYINGSEYASKFINGSKIDEYYFYVDDLAYGSYEFEVVYSGDATHAKVTKKATVDVTYPIEIMHLENNDQALSGLDLDLTASLPRNVNGTVSITVNGKKYSAKARDYTEFKISNIKYGLNEIILAYDGDEIYPAKTKTYTIYGYLMPILENDTLILNMPADATGNMVVRIDGAEYKTVPVTNGKATLKLNDLDVGRYYIEATYDSEDYNVNGFDDMYNAFNISLPEYIWIEEGAIIRVELPKDCNGELIINDVVEEEDEWGDYRTTYKEVNRTNITNGVGSVKLTTFDGITDEDNYDWTFNYYQIVINIDGKDAINLNYKPIVMKDNPDFELKVYTEDNILKYDVLTVDTNLDDGINYIEVYLDGEYYRRYSENMFSLYGKDLDYGSHVIEIRWPGTEYYTSKTGSASFNVTYLTVNAPSEAVIGEYYCIDGSSLRISSDDNVGGYVSVYIDNKLVLMKLMAREVYVDLSNLSYGKHSYEVLYSGDKNHHSKVQSGEFNTIYSGIVYLEDSYINEGENAEITVEMLKDATGKIEITIANKTYTKDVTNASAKFIISDLNVGNYEITAKYLGDEKYPEYIIDTAEVTVTPASEQYYSINVGNTYLKYGENTTVSLTLPDDATGTLYVYIDDLLYKKADLVNGKAVIVISGLKYGEYQLEAKYDSEDYDYDVYTEYESIYVEPVTGEYSRINTFNDKVIIPLEFADDINGDLNVYINDKPITPQKIVNGKVNVDLTGKLDLGFNIMEYKYNNDKYSIDSEAYVYLVPEVIVPQNMTIGEDKQAQFIFGDDYNGNLTVYYGLVNARESEESIVKTKVINGKANISLSELPHGLNYFGFNYVDENYDFSSYGSIYEGKQIRINVLNMQSDVTVFNTTESTKIKFDDDATGSVIVKINGNYFSAELENGEAVIDAVGDEIIISYSGDEKYEGFEDMAVNSSGAETELINPEITVNAEDINVGDIAVISIQANENFTAPVNVTVNNKEYTVNVITGEGSISIEDLSAGIYDIKVIFAGNDIFKKAQKTSKFNVNKLIPTIIIKADESIVEESDLSVEVLIEGATGNVIINDAEIALTDGKATTSISNLTLGEHTISVTYKGDEKYENATNFTKVNIYAKANPELTVKVSDVNVGDDATVNIEINKDATGKVTVDGTEISITEGKGTYTITKPAEGNHTITVKYEGDKYFTQDEKTAQYKVSKKEFPPEEDPIVPQSGNETESESPTYTINLPSDATGTFEVTIANKTYTQELKDGSASITVDDILPGDYTATIKYSGDAKYAPITKTVNTTVNLRNPELKVSVEDVTIGEDAIVNVEINKDATGKVTVDGTEITISNGKGTFTITKPAEGDHTITVKYEGDAYFTQAEKTAQYKVSQKQITPEVDPFAPSADENKTSESTPTFTINMPSDATGTLTVTIGDKTYTKELKDGSASITVDDIPAGDYTATISYSGDAKYAPITKTVNGTVKVDPVIVVKATSVQYNAGKYFQATVYGTDGKLAVNTPVTFVVDKKTFKTVNTDTNGIAKFKVTQIPKTYTVTAKALDKSASAKLTVKHIVTLKSVTVKKSAKKLVLQANLAKVNGKYLAKKKVTFKFNGKTYKKVTDKKGVAKISITKTVLNKLKVGKKITYQATYLKDTVKKTVKVKK